MTPNQNPMKPDNKNFILAIVLSMAIIFGWQYFYRHAAGAEAGRTAPAGRADDGQQAATPAGAASVRPARCRETASAAWTADQATCRVSPGADRHAASRGSINLTGAQVDDLHLKHYRETIDPKSPTITLLSPAGTASAISPSRASFPPAASTVKLPTPKTVWTAPPGRHADREQPRWS